MKCLSAVCLLLLATSAVAQGRFVYLNNQAQPNTITAFQINSDGSLTQLADSPFATGGQGYQGPIESMAIVHTQTGPILYAANGGDPSISAFTITPDKGSLTPIGGSPFFVNDSSGTYDMVASPNGRFLFVTNQAGTVIHVFDISAETGVIREIAGSPFSADANISGLWVTANGKFLLAGDQSASAVQVFAINNSGAISQVPGSPFAANASVSDVRSNCVGDLVFTADNGSDLIDAYTMSANGSLTPVPGSPFYNGAIGSGPNSFDLAISPSGRFLFTTDSFSGDVTSFAIERTGALAPVNGSPFYTSGYLGGAAITAKGDFFYDVDFSSASVGAMAIHPDGTMTQIGSYSGGQISFDGEANSVIVYPTPTCLTASTGQ
jgi:6-phosphogluconolactonase (cycloisomerase 2 family)